jgi:glyoxylase-like metal-dependent hydrolase (beta-lactamase superfamily II)
MSRDTVEVVNRYLRRVLAPNPGPMTLEGTNTWLLGDPAEGPVVVLDPGPDDERHRRRVLEAADGRVSVVVLTHRHADHAAGAPALAAAAGCGVRAADPALQVGPVGLADGDVLALAGAELIVTATPGHTSDSCSLLLRGGDGVVRLLTGDTVLGRGTTVIAAPDGHLGAYLASLDRLQRWVADEHVVELLPGHGPRVTDPAARLEAYRQHRQERLEQVRAALAAGASGVQAVTARVYGDVHPSVRPAAEQSVRAQLEHLGALRAED